MRTVSTEASFVIAKRWTQPKCPFRDKERKTVNGWNGILLSLKMKKILLSKNVSHRKVIIAQFHFHESSKGLWAQ